MITRTMTSALLEGVRKFVLCSAEHNTNFLTPSPPTRLMAVMPSPYPVRATRALARWRDKTRNVFEELSPRRSGP